jgi:hypothetical protein
MNHLSSYFFFAITVFVGAALNGTVVAPAFPSGDYTITTSDSNVWVINFHVRGKFIVTRNGEQAVKGSYKLRDEQIEFIDESGPLARPDAKEGTYEWKYKDKKLTFKVIKDSADGRSSTLTSRSWEMKKK